MDLTWQRMSEQLINESMKQGLPLSMVFELTARCNQKCNMCYVSLPANDKTARAKELTAKQWIELGRQARDAGMLLITLTGGEVFLRQDFREIYEGLLQLGILIDIYSNGTLINEETVKWLSQYPPKKIHITLYGTTKDTCAKITGLADSYERTVTAIEALNEAGVPVGIRTTVVKDNAPEYKAFVDFAVNMKKSLGIVNYISPRREGINSEPEENRLPPQELVDFEEKIVMYSKEQIAGEQVTFDDTQEEEEKDSSDSYSGERYPAFKCTAGRSSGWITWDGRLLGCGLLSKPEAYPLKTGFQAAWSELKHQCSIIPKCKQCEGCQYQEMCMFCPARLLNESGTHDMAAPYLCDKAKILWNKSRYKEVNG